MLLDQAEVDQMALDEAAMPSSVRELGSVLQRKRVALIAERAVLAGPGDIIEIGVLSGGTSMLLAPIASKYGRRFVAVDNWPTNIINHEQYRLDLCEQQCHENVRPWGYCVDVWREDAHAPETLEKIKAGTYSFAFSDDGHLFDDHLKELRALLPSTSGIVCVDDVYLPEVRQAIEAAIGEFPAWTVLYGAGLREAWMVRV